jgi:hypothetical protein
VAGQTKLIAELAASSEASVAVYVAIITTNNQEEVFLSNSCDLHGFLKIFSKKYFSNSLKLALLLHPKFESASKTHSCEIDLISTKIEHSEIINRVLMSIFPILKDAKLSSIKLPDDERFVRADAEK